jgi:UDP-glucose 4-epimerase
LNWLITGGCGFIGTSLITRLMTEKANQNIMVIDNLSGGTRETLAQACSFQEIGPENLHQGEFFGTKLVVGDILDVQLALSLAKDMDIIVHLAANTGVGPSVEDPRADCMANVIGTLNYLEAARHNRVRRFVFASSGAPAGEVEPPIHEELPPKPVSPYGASKLAGEGYCSAYFRTFGLETVALRFGNVYGPGSKHKSSVVAKFIKQAMHGETLEIFGDGTQTRDFIYISDLIDALCQASTTKGIGGEVFQIASSTETTISDLAQTLLRIMEQQGIHNVQVVNAQPRPGDVKRNYSDTSKALKMLDWQPRFALKDGLKETLQYFLNTHLQRDSHV